MVRDLRGEPVRRLNFIQRDREALVKILENVIRGKGIKTIFKHDL